MCLLSCSCSCAHGAVSSTGCSLSLALYLPALLRVAAALTPSFRSLPQSLARLLKRSPPSNAAASLVNEDGLVVKTIWATTSAKLSCDCFVTVEICIKVEMRQEFLTVIDNDQRGSHSSSAEPTCLPYDYGESTDTPNAFHLH